MSTVYNLEPPTRGKVVVNTSMGPLDIELWPKEAPKATRNFVQLCLEGYYDRTIFHRVIKSFLVQGGDPTGSGTGGESIYGEAFADEFHSRLRFNHRGLVACANAGRPHSNGSQFFITLDRCDWLDKKNTIFGKVTGDSIFNLLRIGEVETDSDDRPLHPPPTILSVEVLWDPFDDIIPRQLKPQPAAKVDREKEDKQKKAVKQLNVLSFGEEVEEEEREAENMKEKIKSIHDVLDDPRFIKEELNVEPSTSAAAVAEKKNTHLAVREALSSKKGDIRENPERNHTDEDEDDDVDEADFDARMRLQILKKRREMGDISNHEKSTSDKSSQKNHDISPPRNGADSTRGQTSKVDKLSIKKKGIGSEARAELMGKADVDLELLNHAEQERQMQKQKRRRLHGREEDTLAKLEAFKKSVFASSAKTDSEDKSSDDVSGWAENKLTFVRDSSEKDAMARSSDPNQYVVHDPLLEKGKEKFNKMQAKLKRRDREWAGKPLT